MSAANDTCAMRVAEIDEEIEREITSARPDEFFLEALLRERAQLIEEMPRDIAA